MNKAFFAVLALLVFSFSVAAQTGYGGDGKAPSDGVGSSYIRLYETAPGASTTALAGAGSGNVDNGAHLVKVTCYTSGGETTGGSASNSTTVADKTTNGKIAISAIPTCSRIATGRKVYMTKAGGSTYYLLSNGTITDNSTTSLTANDSDSTLNASTVIPTTNTALDVRVTVGQGMITIPALTVNAPNGTSVTIQSSSAQGTGTTTFTVVPNDLNTANNSVQIAPNSIQIFTSGKGFYANASVISAVSGFLLAWTSSTTDQFGTKDAGIGRNAAGVVEINTGTLGTFADVKTVKWISSGIAFASLGTPSNGSFVYCSDCTIANPCASGGTGAFAKRLNGAWVCN